VEFFCGQIKRFVEVFAVLFIDGVLYMIWHVETGSAMAINWINNFYDLHFVKIPEICELF